MADPDTVPRTGATNGSRQRRPPWRALAIGLVVVALAAAAAGVLRGRLGTPGAEVLTQRSDPQGALDCRAHPVLRRAGPDTLVTLSVPVDEGGELAVRHVDRAGSAASLTFGWAGGDAFHTLVAECYRVTVRVDGRVTSARGSFER